MDTTCLIPGTCSEGTGCDCEVVFLSLHHIKYSFLNREVCRFLQPLWSVLFTSDAVVDFINHYGKA